MNAAVALLLQAVAQPVERRGVDRTHRAPGSEEAANVVHLLPQFERWLGQGVLHSARVGVDADNGRFKYHVLPDLAGDDRRNLGELFAHHQAVGGQLDAVVGLVLPAGLAFHDAQDGASVPPCEDDEVHPARHPEPADRTVDLHLAGEAFLPFSHGPKERQKAGPLHLVLSAIGWIEATHPLRKAVLGLRLPCMS